MTVRLISIAVFLEILLISQLNCVQLGNAYSGTKTAKNESDHLNLIAKSHLSTTQGGFTVNFALTPDHRIWSRGTSPDNPRQLMYSEDMAKSWRFVDVGERLGSEGTIAFINNNEGWAMDSGNVLHTQDGGATWKAQTVPLRSGELTAFSFRDAKVGYLAGSSTRRIEPGLGTIEQGVYILCTNSGGEKWDLCLQRDRHSRISRVVNLEKMTVALTDGGLLLVRSEGSDKWESRQTSFRVSDIDFSPDGVLWACGEDGSVQSSKDGGQHWNAAQLEVSKGSWNSISFDHNGLGAIVGSDGHVALTTNSGRNWKYVNANLTDNLWTVAVSSPFIVILDETTLFTFRVNGES